MGGARYPPAVASLLKRRAKARLKKNWGQCDVLRDALREAGFTVTDGRGTGEQILTAIPSSSAASVAASLARTRKKKQDSVDDAEALAAMSSNAMIQEIFLLEGTNMETQRVPPRSELVGLLMEARRQHAAREAKAEGGGQETDEDGEEDGGPGGDGGGGEDDEDALVVLIEGVPDGSGHGVEASSYFDRLWKEGEKKRRYTLCVTKLD